MVRNPPTREELLEEIARLRRTVARLTGRAPQVPYLSTTAAGGSAARLPPRLTPTQGVSLVDRVSRLFNREAFVAIGNQRLKAINRRSIPSVLLTYRFGNLADISDRLGPETGDDARRAAGVLLRETFRESDLVGQLGEDLFAVLAVDASEEAARLLHERLGKALEGWNDSSTTSPYLLDLEVRMKSYAPDRHSNIEELITDIDG